MIDLTDLPSVSEIRNAIQNVVTEVYPSDPVDIYLYNKLLEGVSEINSIGFPSDILSDVQNKFTELDLDEVLDLVALVFVDKEPLANWAHDCEYLFIAVNRAGSSERNSGSIPARFPPVNFLTSNGDYEVIRKSANHEPDPNAGSIVINALPPMDNAAIVVGEKYALLFSGMSNNRHLNDLEYLYRVLINVYQFDPNNITVLNHDGTVNYFEGPKPVSKWPGDNTPYQIKVNAQGTKDELISALDNIAKKLSPDDFLLIHTNNHGDGPTSSTEDKPSTLCCYPNWDSLTDKEFGDKLATFPNFATLVVMMEQCHSGGFATSIISNSKARQTEFSAAAIKTKNSMGGPNFDPYAFQWIKATHNNTNPSVGAIFQYALANKHPDDTPNQSTTQKILQIVFVWMGVSSNLKLLQ